LQKQLGRIGLSTKVVSIIYRPSSRSCTNAVQWPKVYWIAVHSGLMGNISEPI